MAENNVEGGEKAERSERSRFLPHDHGQLPQGRFCKTESLRGFNQSPGLNSGRGFEVLRRLADYKGARPIGKTFFVRKREFLATVLLEDRSRGKGNQGEYAP
jgi:hypothetical protein